MWVAAAALPVHAMLSWLAVLHMRLGLAGAAGVQAVTLALTILLTAAYICAVRLAQRTWGVPSMRALQVAKLADRAATGDKH